MTGNPANPPLPPDGSVGFGGGESPVRQSRPITVGRVAVWEAEGTLTSSPIDLDNPNFITDAPADGLSYARNGLLGEWVPTATIAGVPEAPTDGRTYTRSGGMTLFAASWEPLPYIIPEAPASGQGFVRNGLNNTWQPAFTQNVADGLYAPRATMSFPEAPNDGIAYARRGWDRSWQPVATGTGLAEAPPTGLTYTRDGLNERWVTAFTSGQAQAQGDARYAPIATVSFPEAPTDGLTYTRNGALRAWEPALSEMQAMTLFAPGWTVSFPEAPTDGRSYARRGADNSWQALPVTENWVTDAPNDGQLYVRSGTAQTWINVQSLNLDGGEYGAAGGQAGLAAALQSGPAGVGNAPPPFSGAFRTGLALQAIAVRTLILNIAATVRSWPARLCADRCLRSATLFQTFLVRTVRNNGALSEDDLCTPAPTGVCGRATAFGPGRGRRSLIPAPTTGRAAAVAGAAFAMDGSASSACPRGLPLLAYRALRSVALLASAVVFRHRPETSAFVEPATPALSR